CSTGLTRMQWSSARTDRAPDCDRADALFRQNTATHTLHWRKYAGRPDYQSTADSGCTFPGRFDCAADCAPRDRASAGGRCLSVLRRAWFHHFAQTGRHPNNIREGRYRYAHRRNLGLSDTGAATLPERYHQYNSTEITSHVFGTVCL